jgi:hypothetical protein
MVTRIVLGALALALFLASPASAEFRLTRGQAEITARGGVSYRYDLDRNDIYVKCRPYKAPSRALRTRYWTCVWDDVSFYPAGEEPCSGNNSFGGTLRVSGMRGAGRANSRVVSGAACRPIA